MERKSPPRIDGMLRKHSLRVPEEIYLSSGILVFGRRIKSIVFTTDLAIIRNVNADAILAVYPFTPQPIITQALLSVAEIPVFSGIGGGITTGERVVKLAGYAELQGAAGVVVNAPTKPETISAISGNVEIPIVVTVVQWDNRASEQIEAGASIVNVAAAANTPAVVRQIREKYPDLPVIASGGTTAETIRSTINAGANAITWTPPSTKQLLGEIMNSYRE